MNMTEKADEEVNKKVDEEEHGKTDEQLDTRNISDLECKTSAEQRRNERGDVLKILTPDQMLRVDYQFLQFS